MVRLPVRSPRRSSRPPRPPTPPWRPPPGGRLLPLPRLPVPFRLRCRRPTPALRPPTRPWLRPFPRSLPTRRRQLPTSPEAFNPPPPRRTFRPCPARRWPLLRPAFRPPPAPDLQDVTVPTTPATLHQAAAPADAHRGRHRRHTDPAHTRHLPRAPRRPGRGHPPGLRPHRRPTHGIADARRKPGDPQHTAEDNAPIAVLLSATAAGIPLAADVFAPATPPRRRPPLPLSPLPPDLRSPGLDPARPAARSLAALGDHKAVQQRGVEALLNRRMDFLMFLPGGHRAVLEVDGPPPLRDRQGLRGHRARRPRP